MKLLNPYAHVKILLSGTLIGLLSVQALVPSLWAQTPPPDQLLNQSLPVSTARTISSDDIIDPQVVRNIQTAVANVYGREHVGEIYDQIAQIIDKARKNRDFELKKQDLSRSSDWYKDEVIYMFYADQFGVKGKNQKNTFKDLIGMLPYLKGLGVTTIYILPFMDSPMGDAGFDVRDPRKVRQDLGGIDEFKQFMAAAQAQGIKIKGDLVLNHFSDQHAWFQAALKGDEEKLHYFVVSEKPPVYKRYVSPEQGVTVDYTEDDGRISSRRLLFSDYSENHYRKETINGKDYYFYHTFYPFQLDINWQNPKVLYEVLNTIAYWSNLGIDIFRLDAVTFFIKDKGTNAESRPMTHDIVKILSSFIQAVGPRSVMQAEACQWPKDILPYFGTEENISIHSLGKTKVLRRSDEFQIAYNFPYMPALWASLLMKNKEYFWQAVHKTPALPETASWANFLRIHDQLSLEMLDVPTQKRLYDSLITKGAEFQTLGVSGRMAGFLDNDPLRIEQAFAVLLSLPGIPIIYYGDEIGAPNNFEYAHAMEKERESVQKSRKLRTYFDSRDINRGPILKSAFDEAVSHPQRFDGMIYADVRNLIAVRKQNPALTRGTLTEVPSNHPEVFGYLRSYSSQHILAVNNLSGQPAKVEITLPAEADIQGQATSEHTFKDILTQAKIPYQTDVSRTRITLNLKPYQSLWLLLS